MSYNIGSILILSSKSFELPAAKGEQIKLDQRLPEINFLSGASTDIGIPYKPETDRLDWCGEFSGSSFPAFRGKVLPLFNGSADLAVIWEGGDDITGLRLRNHKVTEHPVVIKLKVAK